MATDRMALVDVLRKGEDPAVDFLKEGVRWLVQELMEAEVSAQIGAGRYERTDERTTQRNGYRTRPWDTRVGTIDLAMPKLRSGSYFPRWLEARQRGQGGAQRRAAGAQAGRQGALPGGGVAAVPRPLYEESPGPRAQECAGHGRRHGAHHLRSARPGGGGGAARAGGRGPCRALPGRHAAPARCRG